MVKKRRARVRMRVEMAMELFIPAVAENDHLKRQLMSGMRTLDEPIKTLPSTKLSCEWPLYIFGV